MGGGRIPGPYGVGLRFGCVLRPGPLGDPDDWDERPHVPTGLVRVGAGGGIHPAPSTSGDTADEDELKLLVRVFGSVKSRRGRAYSYTTGNRKNRVRHYRTTEYMTDRNAFFGSADAYWQYLDVSRAELDANDASLRRVVEPPTKDRPNLSGWEEAQDVFYAWVRKAYEKKLGEGVDVPALISRGMSDTLKAALDQVRHDYTPRFRAGGFNPRPMKLNGYKLGTLSDHALGDAIDIESGSNPHLEAAQWAHILAFTGKTLDHRTRQTLWRTDPKQLHDSIVEISRAFVTQLGIVVQLARAAQAARQAAAPTPAAGSGSKQKKGASPDALAEAVEQNAHLKGLKVEFVRKWQNGFFTLPWALVKELHEEGFRWGAIFSDPDLHHFEL